MNYTSLIINAVISMGAYIVAIRIIPGFRDVFLKARLSGKDMCKRESKEIPESMGVIIGCVFLVVMFFFIPIPYMIFGANSIGAKSSTFPHEEFVELIVALLTICCMILLGFADDVLNLRWRHKLLLPAMATLPLLMVYYVNYNSTTIILPKFARPLLGSYSLDIGIFYYIYMGALAVFSTNAINILAGINGLEVGQSLIIATSILIFNFIELFLGHQVQAHEFSIFLTLPFLAVSLALWKYNKYPSRVFVGDTFCYFAGTTFAVIGILGHFSKTLLLFFIPQIINFLYSTPQLFKFVPCPRHRLPKYDSEVDLLRLSTVEFHPNELCFVGRYMVFLLKALKLISWQELPDGRVITNNFTLINLTLLMFGPVHEKILTQILMGFQAFCTILAFVIRYPLADYFYDT